MFQSFLTVKKMIAILLVSLLFMSIEIQSAENLDDLIAWDEIITQANTGSYKTMIPLKDESKVLLILKNPSKEEDRVLFQEYEALKQLKTHGVDTPLLENLESYPKLYSLSKYKWELLCDKLDRHEYYYQKGKIPKRLDKATLKSYSDIDLIFHSEDSENNRIIFYGMIEKKIKGFFMHIGNDKNLKNIQSKIFEGYSDQFLKEFEFDENKFKNFENKLEFLKTILIDDLQLFLTEGGDITVIDPQKVCGVNEENRLQCQYKLEKMHERINIMKQEIYKRSKLVRPEAFPNEIEIFWEKLVEKLEENVACDTPVKCVEVSHVDVN